METLDLQRLYNVHMYGIKRADSTRICELILLQNINLLYKIKCTAYKLQQSLLERGLCFHW